MNQQENQRCRMFQCWQYISKHQSMTAFKLWPTCAVWTMDTYSIWDHKKVLASYLHKILGYIEAIVLIESNDQTWETILRHAHVHSVRQIRNTLVTPLTHSESTNKHPDSLTQFAFNSFFQVAAKLCTIHIVRALVLKCNKNNYDWLLFIHHTEFRHKHSIELKLLSCNYLFTVRDRHHDTLMHFAF
jgi:hypothetical protein